MMNKQVLLLGAALLAAALTGCSSAPSQPQPVPVTPAPEPAQNQEMVRALNQLNEIQQELKSLRNSVEELQFETENGKRRQQDLFQDLDRRLVDLERNQRVLSPGSQITGQTGSQSDVVVDSSAGQSTIVENTTQTASDGSQVNEVVVVSSDSSGTVSESVTTTVTPPATGGAVTLEQQSAYDAAFDLLKQSRYEDAILGFQSFVDTWPTSTLADDAWYWMSEARYVNREFEYALSGFRTVVSQYPDSPRVPEALLKVGYIQYDIGNYDDAAATFRDILARFPGNQVTVPAETRLNRIEQTIQ